MIVERIWTNNAMRNFIYLLACPETGEAAAIDPLEHEMCLERARQRGWRITQLINTHEHGDHIQGNGPVLAETGARLLAPRDAPIKGVDTWLGGGDFVTVGRARARILNTPGHTMTHISLWIEEGEPALICGDVLFNAGVGNCHNGGDPRILHETIEKEILPLPDAVRIFPGHDYLETNLEFSHAREPDNDAVSRMQVEIKASGEDGETRRVLTMKDERAVNPFLRLTSPSILTELKRSVPDFSGQGGKDAFLALRALRNSW